MQRSPAIPLGRDRHAEELPGKVILFHIVPLDPAHKVGLAGHVPVEDS
jgi:hypothetical protein